MKVGGLIKNSLIDFPGRPALVIFTQGCSWRCPFCHNPRLIARRASCSLKIDSIFELLAKRPARARNLVITGGEPTEQADLIPTLCRAKHIGARVKLDTNGSNPKVLRRVVQEGLAEYIALDVKGPLARYSKFTGGIRAAEAMQESISLLLHHATAYEFRTTVVPALHRPADFAAVGESLQGGRQLYLQGFRRKGVLDRELRETSEPTAAFLRECAAYAEPYIPTLVR
ncbi:MAG: anaerobic ribonucleoside-triphosphate reductase activating protein [Puniceicoccales bacterium]